MGAEHNEPNSEAHPAKAGRPLVSERSPDLSVLIAGGKTLPWALFVSPRLFSSNLLPPVPPFFFPDFVAVPRSSPDNPGSVA